MCCVVQTVDMFTTWACGLDDLSNDARYKLGLGRSVASGLCSHCCCTTAGAHVIRGAYEHKRGWDADIDNPKLGVFSFASSQLLLSSDTCKDFATMTNVSLTGENASILVMNRHPCVASSGVLRVYANGTSAQRAWAAEQQHADRVEEARDVLYHVKNGAEYLNTLLYQAENSDERTSDRETMIATLHSHLAEYRNWHDTLAPQLLRHPNDDFGYTYGDEIRALPTKLVEVCARMVSAIEALEVEVAAFAEMEIERVRAVCTFSIHRITHHTSHITFAVFCPFGAWGPGRDH